MTALELKSLRPVSITPEKDKDDEYSIPLDISDIINICREYNSLGWNIQNQIESILECGIEESIKSGMVQRTSLPHIKHFLTRISQNAYFGDAVSQAHDCIKLILQYEEKYKVNVLAADIN